MRQFSVCATQAYASANKTFMALAGHADVVGLLSQLMLSCPGTPADHYLEFKLWRFTTAGVGGSALTEEPCDSEDAAAKIAATQGTYGTSDPVTAGTPLLWFSMNTRAVWQWWANPGHELRIPPATAKGLALNFFASSSTPTADGVLHWSE